jgi:TrmH family RNA methyltransferase
MLPWADALENVRRAVTARGRATLGAFASEGQRLLERGVRAGWCPRQVLFAASLRGDAELGALVGSLASRGCRCFELPDAALLELSQGRRSGLVSALFELPPNPPLAELAARGPEPAVFLALMDIDEPGNVGALLRTALASGISAVFCAGQSDPFHPKAVRTSLGSLFKLPLFRAVSASELLADLQRLGVYCVAAVARGGEPLGQALWPRHKLALLVGNEGQGLPEALQGAADARVTIDLSQAVDSYSVNAAAAVCLYEIQRRLRA